MSVFRLPKWMAREIIEHAQEEYPRECCGILGGPPGAPVKVFRLVNIDPDPVMRYNADPKALKRATDEIYENDWDVVAIYHSHTHSPAYPSQTDVARAYYPEATYILTSLQDRMNPDLRAFRILEEQIEELEVVQDDEG